MTRKEAESQPDRVKRLIRDRGHTYESLAAEIGVTPQAIYAMVHGNTKGATARYALAKALGLNVADLFEDDRAVPTAA
jgi:transcriptional regulator with XRE-family HTH domain